MSEFDHSDLLARYLQFVSSRNKGDDMLSVLAPFDFAEVAEMRKLSLRREPNPMSAISEKVGGDTPGPGGWLANSAALKGLPGHDD